MRRFIPSVLLLFLLLFLLPIYFAAPNNEVLLLSVLLLAVGLFLAFGNQPRGLEVLAAITVLISFIGMAFLGRNIAGQNGAYCFGVLWIVTLLGGALLLWRRATVVERGQILVVNQLPENRALIFNEGVHRPLTPSFERRVAVLPSYELLQETELLLLNTESLFNVDKIEVLVRYRVQSPRDVVFCFPNREQAFEQLERERGSPETNSDCVAFWTELIRRQMALELDEVVRAAVANIGGPTEVAKQRSEHARRVKIRLQEMVTRWGIDVLDLRFLEVVIDPDRIRAANRDKIIERELQDASRNATLHAEEVEKVGTAQAKATARMVSEIVAVLKEQGATLSSEDLEKVVITAMQRMTDTQQLSGFFRQLTQAGQSSAAASAGARTPGAPTPAPGAAPQNKR